MFSIQELNKFEYLLFDLDGTLSEYRFGKMHLHAETEKDYIEYCKLFDPYENVRPLKTMQRLITELHSMKKKVFVVTVSQSRYEKVRKTAYIERNFPEIPRENIIHVSDPMQKVSAVRNLIGMNNIKPTKVCMTDDRIDTLLAIEEFTGAICFHSSHFVE